MSYTSVHALERSPVHTSVFLHTCVCFPLRTLSPPPNAALYYWDYYTIKYGGMEKGKEGNTDENGYVWRSMER